MAQLTEGHDGDISPGELMDALQVHHFSNAIYNHLFVRHDTQHDASEALIAVMQTFEEQSEEYKKFMMSLFAFRIFSILECGQCGKRKETVAENETVLAVEIQEGLNFQTLLCNYFKPEKLDEGNANECVGCKEKPVGTKQLQTELGPEIAIFLLKRFQTNPKSRRFNSTKITSFVGL